MHPSQIAATFGLETPTQGLDDLLGDTIIVEIVNNPARLQFNGQPLLSTEPLVAANVIVGDGEFWRRGDNVICSAGDILHQTEETPVKPAFAFVKATDCRSF